MTMLRRSIDQARHHAMTRLLWAQTWRKRLVWAGLLAVVFLVAFMAELVLGH